MRHARAQASPNGQSFRLPTASMDGANIWLLNTLASQANFTVDYYAISVRCRTRLPFSSGPARRNQRPVAASTAQPRTRARVSRSAPHSLP